MYISSFTARLAACLLIVLVAGCGGPQSAVDETGSGESEPERGVILLRYSPGSESTEQREEGFLNTLRDEFPDIHVLSSNQYAGTTPEGALEKSQQLLLRYGDRVDGIFCVCEPVAYGMFRALEEAGMIGEVPYVGFDPNATMVAALENGKMEGIVLQDPVQMGYLAVKTMVAHLEGEEVEKRISTGEYVATPENYSTEEMQRLLKPAQFSGSEFQPESVKYTIAVIPKGTTHEFWKSVHAGADQAARELGNVEIEWKGPLLENDREGQINVVQDFVTRQVDGICLAPLDSQALVPAVEDAHSQGIPTVIFDSDLSDGGRLKVSYVATDNFNGGALAARRLAEVIQQEGGESGP